ncbi:MAG: ATP-binding protein [Chloroflexota bacterium]
MNPDALSRADRLLGRLGLHQRIAVFISTVLLVVFVALGYVGWEGVRRSTENTLQERRSTALVVAEHLDDLMEHALGHLVVVSRDVADQADDAGSLAADGSLRALSSALRHTRFFFSHLVLFGADGRFLLSTAVQAQPSIEPATQIVIERTIATREPMISSFLHLPIERSPGVIFAVPIVRADRLLGVLAGEMRLPHPSISTIAGTLSLGQTGHVEVVDGQGVVLASTHSDDEFETTEHSSFYRPLLQQRLTTVGRALYEGHHNDGSETWHIMAFVPLDHAPWGVGLGQDEAETFAATRELRDRTLVVSALVLAVALSCMWVGTQSVVRPIRALTRSGERMATGDLSQPIALPQPDEVGRLARVLDQMRRQLGDSLAEIRGWNRELEHRVSERTSELLVSNRHLHALMAVAAVSGRGGGRQDVLEHALDELVGTLGAVGAWACLWEEPERRLQLVASCGVDLSTGNGVPTASSAGDACLAALKSCDVVNSPADGCSLLCARARGAQSMERCWCTAIRLGEQALGTICLVTEPGRRLDEAEEALLQGIAHQVAVAFENARLTEETARLEAARRIELLQAEFLAAVSHELRTPLGFIKGYATTLLRDDVQWEPSQQRELLQIIDEEADRLTEFVESLLEAGRAQSNRLRLQFQPVRIDHVLRQCVARIAGSLDGHTIQTAINGTPTVEADRGRVEQVVVNLLQNAIKYSPEGETVSLHLMVEPSGALISVLDRGVGIPPSEISRVFEPFYRVASGHTMRAGGSGLGLAICRAIVEAHGGAIWAEARPGGGTAMHVRLPWRAPEGSGVRTELEGASP